MGILRNNINFYQRVSSVGFWQSCEMVHCSAHKELTRVCLVRERDSRSGSFGRKGVIASQHFMCDGMRWLAY